MTVVYATDFLFGVTPLSTVVFTLCVLVFVAVGVWLIRRERRIFADRLGGTIDLVGVPVSVVAPDPDDFGFVDFLGWDAPGRFADFRVGDEAA